MEEEFTTLSPEGSENAIAHFETEKRVLVRPNISIKRAVLLTFLSIVGIFFVGVVCWLIFRQIVARNSNIRINAVLAGFIGAGIAFLILLVIASKKVCIFLVRVYQRYAPEETRLRCVYTPSCSEYMILAIEKYGVIKGIYKGVCRLMRCKEPNGGEDLP